MKDKYKEIIEEWDYEKNGEVNPDKITLGSGKKIWWKCKKGHSYQRSVYDKVRYSSCPYCNNKKVLAGFNDFATKHPELLLEWDFDKNQDVNPYEIFEFSHKRVWWKCNKDHEWDSTVVNRSRGYNCPYCSNQKVLAGYNDLASQNPELAEEWNFLRNNDLLPSQVTPAGKRKVWWKCIRGHEWEDTIAHRSGGRGCPVCNRGLKTSFPEQAIFYYLKMLFQDIQSRYTKLGFELDLYVPSIKLGIEYDGGVWHQNEEKELKKINECKKHGIQLIKIREPECVPINDDGIKIYRVKNHSVHALQEVIIILLHDLQKEYGINKNILVNLSNDNVKILKMIGVYEVENSLLKLRPELAEEWNYKKNEGLTPEMLGSKSSQKVWWKCSRCGNEWKQSPNARRTIGSCPKCIYEIVEAGKNNLVTMRPELAKEWNYEKNQNLFPEQVSNTSRKEVWWRCNICEYEWEEAIWKRNNKVLEKRIAHCPNCLEQKIQKRKEQERLNLAGNLINVRPDLMTEWNYQKNGELMPEVFLCGSGRKVWWICSHGHEYEAIINNRVRLKSSCPYCANQKLLVGFNDLATTNPELVEEWNYEKNYPNTPTTVISKGKVWWKCKKCRFEWQAEISSRKAGCGCPQCAIKERADNKCKRVGMYDKVTNKLLKEFDSVQDAEREMHNKNISTVCKGKRKTAGGYIWKYL